MIGEAIKVHGRLHAVINTIGPYQEQDLLTMEPPSWRDMIDLNLNVAFTTSHFAIPFLIENKGQILNFTYSGADNLTAWPQAAAYASAKAGLAVLTKSLAHALGSKGVRVNAISPGRIDFGKFTEDEQREFKGQVPMGRLGQPMEVVDLAQWIMMESPEFMTGSMIALSGAQEF